MISTEIPHPQIASKEEWLAARKTLLAKEKEHTKAGDRIHAQLRRLPMVKIDKDYEFEGPEGKQSLKDLFKGQTQLVVYHFMFDPADDAGCPGCTGFVQALGDLSMLEERNTRFVLISRAPLAKLQAYAKKMGWDRPWYSSFGSDFNYDYHVTHDKSKAPVEYNFLTEEEMNAKYGPREHKGESHGMSVFFRMGDEVFHTYSVYARGMESITDSYAMLDITPYGRQEDWEDSPAGYPQKPTYG